MAAATSGVRSSFSGRVVFEGLVLEGFVFNFSLLVFLLLPAALFEIRDVEVRDLDPRAGFAFSGRDCFVPDCSGRDSCAPDCAGRGSWASSRIIFAKATVEGGLVLR